MGNPSEKKNGAALLEELIRQLKSRESIGGMLGDFDATDPSALATQLIDELERIIKWRHLEHQLLAKTPASPPAKSEPPAPSPPVMEAPSLRVDPAPLPKQTEPPAAKPHPPPEQRAEKPEQPEPAMQDASEEEGTAGETESSPQKQVPRVPSELREDDLIYLHGVGKIQPGDTPSSYPFMLEEKGIDNRTFAFALDHRGLRFYGSVVNADAVNLTKNGVLLLNKQEKTRMRGAHESILNELRLHQILLPFEFGTVARGSEDLIGKIEGRFTELRDALEDLLSTRWWNVTVYSLDNRIAELVGTSDSAERRAVERGRMPYSSPQQARRIDVKTLERILNKQKRTAESIHAALQQYAERSDIDMIVNLQSGSSDDWKIILKVSYELNPNVMNQFVRTVTDLQYQHFLMELMVSLTGNVDCFSFEKQ